MKDLTFIETQFPIARLSAEAYKERKANNGQTLTRLGKWWGRKPLILVRASIIGMLMPASDDPKKDREIFLKILTMDDDGVWARCKGNIPVAAWKSAASEEQLEKYFSGRSYKRGTTDEEKDRIKQEIWASLSTEEQKALDDERKRATPDRKVFDAMPYAERIRECYRPENVIGPSSAAWVDINTHLGTSAESLQDLVAELGKQKFGRIPRVGDAFCGGGSIPFEAARIGCEAFGSDLNPVAALLTWASLNILGGGSKVQEEVMQAQTEAFEAADQQITKWGIEHNEKGERADAYLYCVEVKPEGHEYYVPLSPSWLVGEKSKVICRWERTPGTDRLQPIVETVDSHTVKKYKAKHGATVKDSRIIDPLTGVDICSVESLRGPDGLRLWTRNDIIPQPNDVFQERLYCIRWIDKDGNKRFRAPNDDDESREELVCSYLQQNLEQWQSSGSLPSGRIPPGKETDRLPRQRGWQYWQQLFSPRQLLVHGLLSDYCTKMETNRGQMVGNCLGLARIANWNSKLCLWMSNAENEGGSHVFNSLSLNPLFNYSVRPLPKLSTAWPVVVGIQKWPNFLKTQVRTEDARDLEIESDIWMTDPPYADAVNYHELGDFFLSWFETRLANEFPKWSNSSRADLAVKGDGEDFRQVMVEIYRNLASRMPDIGMQMVMFTHQNPAVWADLGMILWAAGLKATAAWTISTETEAVGIKKGNYVQGTVCMVLRKRNEDQPGFLDEVYPLVEDEVKRQITSMQALDEDGEPNFNDADYQLAAYAAALKVLTQYATLDGREVEHEVFAVRDRNEKSEFQTVIERALEIACDALVPKGLEMLWRDLSLVERYYLRALDIESRGERRKGMYEELARGFGLSNIRPLLKSDKANGARMYTSTGFSEKGLVGLNAEAKHPFASSPLRHLLYAIRETGVHELSPEPARQYLYDTFGAALYWQERERLIGLLDWLAALGNAEGMQEWADDSEASRILAGRLRNDEG